MYNLCMYYEKQKSYDKTELTFQPTLVLCSTYSFAGFEKRGVKFVFNLYPHTLFTPLCATRGSFGPGDI